MDKQEPKKWEEWEYIDDIEWIIGMIKAQLKINDYAKASLFAASVPESIEGLIQVLMPLVDKQFEEMKSQSND